MTKVAVVLVAIMCLSCTSLAGANARPVTPSAPSASSTGSSATRTQQSACQKRTAKRKRAICVAGRWYHDNSAWNTRIPANPPISPRSASLISALTNKWCPKASCLGPTMVSVPAVWVASSRTKLVTIQINYPTCKAGRVRAPIPANAVPDGPPEGSMTVMVSDTGVEWDFFKLTRPGATPLSSGPKCDATGDWAATRVARAQPGWRGSGTFMGSPRASGTLYGSGLIRPRDTKRPAGASWDHAIALAYPGTLAGVHAWPAVRTDGRCTDQAACIPEGGRLQLDPAVNCNTWPSLTAVWLRQLCRTLQRYGLIVVDTGSALLVQHPASLGSYVYPWAPSWGTLPVDLATRLRVIDWTRWTGGPKAG